MTENQASNSILDADWDEFEDLPEFKTFPRGTYIVGMTMKEADNGFKVFMTHEETISVDEADAEILPAPEVGDVTSFGVNMENEIGRANAKAFKQKIELALNEKMTGREMVTQFSKPLSVKVVLSRRTGKRVKEDGSKAYFQTIVDVYAA